ncbi:MAG TPA: glycoside hydrolase family 44 protein [Acidobacteriaceae bacterium]
MNRSLPGISALALGPLLFLAGCGGAGSGSTPPPTTYALTVNSSNPTSGVVIGVTNPLTSLSTSGTTSFSLTENAGTTLTLVAPANAGSNTFTSWSGCTSTTGQSCTVTINSNTTVTANYTTPSPTVYTLTVASTNPASGVAITSNTPDTNSISSGSSQFTLAYDSGASVTLTAPATASNGNTFSSWTGCTSTSGHTCTITISANATVTANYATPVTPVYNLTVASANPASGIAITASPADNNNASSGNSQFMLTYNSGTPVTLTAPATASNGNTFSSWTGCTSTTGDTCTVTVSANATVTANYATPSAYTLNVHTSNPATGITITDSPADNNSVTSAVAPVTLRYAPNTVVTITAPTSVTGGNVFSAWTGCTSTSGTSNNICSIKLSASTTITAAYVVPTPTVTISPSTSSLTIGSSQQFTASVQNESNMAVTWSVAVTSGSGSAGTISSTGLYQTPYPAPTSVTVTATSVADPTVKDTMTFNLSAPATTTGPALTIDATHITMPISPLIYGMNAYLLDSGTASSANITVARWGGDDVSRYNYQTGVTNSANDYYFENFSGAGGMLGSGSFNGFITAVGSNIKTIGTAPVNGWVSNSTQKACSFPKSTTPDQQSFNGDNCGNGVSGSGTSLVGNATIAAITSLATPPPSAPGAGNATTTWADATWTGGWVNCLINNGPDCSAAGGKDATIWDLDNEPEYWSAVHRDVHPNPMTYDEITNGGIGTALAIKTTDSAAQVSGPVISGWYQYFYSQQDVNNGYGAGPCYQPWGNPMDRTAHGGVPLIEYYIQQMSSASDTYNLRLLDYVDIHAYYAAVYNGSSVAFTTAGDTGEQEARMNSTRAFWDPTYTDPNNHQLYQPVYPPTYPSGTTQTSAVCTTPASPDLIPMLQKWAATDWTSTKFSTPLKTSIDEYNFGGTESINGAVTQADVLGIFGKYGLDMGVFWPTTNYTTQIPGNMAFAIYRNYDGSKSTFGDSELSSITTDQSQLAVYAAKRTSDDAVTIVVINKTYGPLTSTLSIANLAATGNAKVYQYSNANLAAIVAQPDATITPPASGGTTSTVSATFPAQSITLLVIPQ